MESRLFKNVKDFFRERILMEKYSKAYMNIVSNLIGGVDTIKKAKMNE